MKLISIALIFLLFSAKSYALPFDQCSRNSGWIENRYDEIRSASNERDVSDKIYQLERVLGWGDCPSTLVEEARTSLNAYRTRGLRNHINFMKREARRVSAFRSPEAEFEEIELAQARLQKENYPDIPEGLSESMMNLYREQGRRNSQQRRTSCSNKDNRRPPLVEVDQSGNVTHNNMRNQDSIGWCYAFTAADLLSVELGRNVSAVDVANAYNDGTWSDFFNFNESDMEGGFTASAANAAIERGLCLESQLPSDDYVFSTNSGSLMQELVAVEGLYTTYRERVPTRRGSDPTNAIESFQQDISCSRIATDYDQIFPNIDVGELVSILGQATSENDFIDKMIERSCRPRITPPARLRYEDDSTFTSTNTLMSRMDEKLDNGKVLGLHYKASTIKDRLDSSSGNHASLVVARRFNQESGSCEYLIRNSWGTGCSAYDGALECDEGNIWLPEEYMRQTITGIIYAD